MMSLEQVSQIGISTFGIIALILVIKKNKWGFVCGLISQPFWLYTAYHNNQTGVFIVSVAYGFTWMYGIYEWFFKNPQEG